MFHLLFQEPSGLCDLDSGFQVIVLFKTKGVDLFLIQSFCGLHSVR